MAVDGGYGPKGHPLFSPSGGFEDWIDLQEVGKYAALVGNRMAGTKAEREALSTSTTAQKQAWNGLEFYETDTRDTYLYASGWILWESWPRAIGTRVGLKPPITWSVSRGIVTIAGIGGKAVGSYGLGTVPAQARPLADTYFTVAGASTDRVLVRASGSVEATNANANEVTLDIRFPVAWS